MGGIRNMYRQICITVRTVYAHACHSIRTKIVAMLVCKENGPNKRQNDSVERRECQILAELSHPNIVTFIDVEYRKAELRLYMEYYEHKSLDDLIRRCVV